MMRTASSLQVISVAAGLIITSLQPCGGQTWVGADDFSSGISAANWTTRQNAGQMSLLGTNGHVSFIVPSSTVDEQSAYLLWNGTPRATDDWTMDIFGHNSALWSSEGSSQLQLIVADTATLNTTNIIYWGVKVRRGDVNEKYPFTASFYGSQAAQAPSANFGLRVVHRGGITGNIEAWYDPAGSGLASTLLSVKRMTDFSPGMTAGSTFSLLISSDTYYGPLVEGDIWVDNFRLTEGALGSPLPQVSLTTAFQPALAVRPAFSNLLLTTNYQLQCSSDLEAWTSQGSAFTATNSSMVYPQYFDVADWGRRFFRLEVAP